MPVLNQTLSLAIQVASKNVIMSALPTSGADPSFRRYD